MKTKDNLLLTGLICMAAGGFIIAGAVYYMLLQKALHAGAIMGSIAALFMFAFGLLMVSESIRRNRRLKELKRDGVRLTGRIFSYRMGQTNELELRVRYFDEDGAVRQALVTTEGAKKEDYPIGTDVSFVMLGRDAALLERIRPCFTEEEHWLLAGEDDQ